MLKMKMKLTSDSSWVFFAGCVMGTEAEVGCRRSCFIPSKFVARKRRRIVSLQAAHPRLCFSFARSRQVPCLTELASPRSHAGSEISVARSLVRWLRRTKCVQLYSCKEEHLCGTSCALVGRSIHSRQSQDKPSVGCLCPIGCSEGLYRHGASRNSGLLQTANSNAASASAPFAGEDG